jgi:hypothetical protein
LQKNESGYFQLYGNEFVTIQRKFKKVKNIEEKA